MGFQLAVHWGLIGVNWILLSFMGFLIDFCWGLRSHNVILLGLNVIFLGFDGILMDFPLGYHGIYINYGIYPGLNGI